MAHKTVIIGSGPAGHTAAIYCARASMNPVMYEGMMAGGIAPGGQLTTTTELENFPGFPEGVMGLEFTENLRKQSARFGTVIHTKTISKVDLSTHPFRLWCEGEEESAAILADTIIVATGATARRLPAEGVDKFWQKGVSACAVCDGGLPIFRNQEIAVVGGGDTACEEALYLTKHASMVHIIHRRDKLRASKVMQERVLNSPKIRVHWNRDLKEAYGDRRLAGIKLADSKTGEISDLPVKGLFFAIGHTPNTGFLKGSGVELDEAGYVKTVPGTTRTSVDGVFAAGDCQDKRYRQAVTAAGTGCMAAIDCQHWLEEHSKL